MSATSAAPRPVIRSLYRSVLREAQKLDKLPITKTLLPMPRRLQDAAGLTSQLHMPGTINYATVARQLFRDEQLPVKVGFDALMTLRSHLTTVSGEMPKVLRDHAQLLKILDTAAPDPRRFSAAPVPLPTSVGKALQIAKPDGTKAPGALDVQLSAVAREALLRREGFELKVGHGLIAHPLSSAHTDRRVMLVIDKNPTTTTAVVLDMLYSYPLSHGNPMFPEVFWGHEVHNGGYCHVDFTMPPTANIQILHTLEPPAPEMPNYSRWLHWATRQNPEMKKQDPEAIQAAHKACCSRVIQSTEKDVPSLYASGVEALPYLSTLAQGQPRSALRIYWGCMKWSTPQLVTEIATGHWMPVELTPQFFGAYDVHRRPEPTEEARREDGVVGPVDEERFPTEEHLRDAQRHREKTIGADITQPQVFPPTQPLCRREALWDQILHSMGGDFRSLVGCINPFVSSRSDVTRVPPIGPPGVAEAVDSELPDGGEDDGVEFEVEDVESFVERVRELEHAEEAAKRGPHKEDQKPLPPAKGDQPHDADALTGKSTDKPDPADRQPDAASSKPRGKKDDE